jgi:hypothetical protein
VPRSNVKNTIWGKVVASLESVLPVACPNTKSDSECELTNLLVGFDVGPSN